MQHKDKKIVLFDGVCHLCNGSVQFIVDHDKNQIFYFAPLQSDFGRDKLKKLNMEQNYLDGIVLIENGQAFHKSTAALKIARKLNRPWPLFYAFMIFPKTIRDFFYDIIAENRYRWFGKDEVVCRMITPEVKNRLL